MGLFSGGSKKVPTLDISGIRRAEAGRESFSDVFGRAEERAGRIAPLALGARESALADIGTPESSQEFFGGFGPTSLEQALADQQFANVTRDVERSIKQNLSLAGIASSPILAQQIGRARGELGVDIGTVLANLAQQRAVGSLNARLGIDPFGNVLLPQAGQDLAQSNLSVDQQVMLEQLQAQADLQAKLGKQKQRADKIANIGTLIGTGLGVVAAPFTGGLSLAGGAALGGALGGTAAGAFGGSSAPVSLGDALSVAEAFPKKPRGGTQKVFDRQSEVLGFGTRKFS